MKINRHFIKEKIDCRAICMPFVLSTQQIVDIFTKGLFRTSFELFISKLGMKDILFFFLSAKNRYYRGRENSQEYTGSGQKGQPKKKQKPKNQKKKNHNKLHAAQPS